MISRLGSMAVTVMADFFADVDLAFWLVFVDSEKTLREPDACVILCR